MKPSTSKKSNKKVLAKNLEKMESNIAKKTIENALKKQNQNISQKKILEKIEQIKKLRREIKEII